MKIIELLIEDNLMDNPDVGIDGIALVNRPAHMENWLAFSHPEDLKQPFEVLTDEEMDELAQAVTSLGEDAEMDGWEIVKVEQINPKNEFVGVIKSDPNKVSEEDTPEARVRYKYVGPQDNKNRPFCAEMMRKNLVYRIEDIQSLSDRQVNTEMSKYDGYYDIFEWRGSYNCRHKWVKLFYAPIDAQKGSAQNRIINKGSSNRNLENQQQVPARDTTTTAAANNGYDALAFSLVDIIDNYPVFDSKAEAEQIAEIIGCRGYHTHEVNGNEYYMPCEGHPTEMAEMFDVPQYARDKACKARKYKEENPSISCGTRVGWTRSAQLCNGDKVSRDIIARMSAFGRHLANAEKQDSYEDGCALLMVDAWGGKEGIEWAQKELERIDSQEFLDENPCQPGWVAYGTKEKNGRTVPNCIPEKNTQSKLKFNLNDDKMEITGAAIVPNKLIIRSNALGEPYYVYFSEETIKKLAYKFMKEKRQDATNIEHTNIKAKDTYVAESWIVDDPLDDKANALGLDYPKGTWVITMKTDDPKVWSDIKAGKYAGFSVEGYFTEKAIFSEDDVLVEQIKNILNTTKDEQ